MDEFSFATDLLAGGLVTPEIVRLNAVLLLAATLAVALPVAVHRLMPRRPGFRFAMMR